MGAVLAERGVLLSIRPKFIDAILAETKTVELRRSRIQAAQGTPVLLYSSTPVKAVIGAARIALIDEGPPERLWVDVGSQAGVTRVEFDDYFEGTDIAYGLHLISVRRLPRPIPLTALRDLGLEPPQSFRYLSIAQQEQLAASAGSAASSQHHTRSPFVSRDMPELAPSQGLSSPQQSPRRLLQALAGRLRFAWDR